MDTPFVATLLVLADILFFVPARAPKTRELI